MAQRLKHLPAMREAWVRSLGWEDPLEKEMATHSSILAWRIPWMEEPGGLYSSWGRTELDATEQLHFLALESDGKMSAYNAGGLGSIPGLGRSLGEGNGNPSSTLAWKIS